MTGNRCLSPLLIPPRPQPGIDPTVGPASPLGALQPDLYRMPDGPVYLTAPGTSHAVGRLHLRVKYDYHLFDLTVHLIEGMYSHKIPKDFSSTLALHYSTQSEPHRGGWLSGSLRASHASAGRGQPQTSNAHTPRRIESLL